jgi:hypothetical protein
MTNATDQDYGSRKLDHYNKWLLDPKRPSGERYPGFPEDVMTEKARAKIIAEYTAKAEARAAAKDLPEKKKKASVKKPVSGAKKAKSLPGESKLDKAIVIFERIGDNKAVVIETIQKECGMTPLGAQTYYYNARKHFSQKA